MTANILFLLALVPITLIGGFPSKTRHLNRLPHLHRDRGDSRIVGGNEATKNSYPHQANLNFYTAGANIDDFSLCGGTLINETWVLTAAHCSEGSVKVKVTLGAHNIKNNENTQQIFWVERSANGYFEHEQYDSYNIANDIALLKLPTAATLNDAVKILHLPNQNTPANTTAVAIGWGVTSDDGQLTSDVLMEVNVITITVDKCQESWGDDGVKDTNICISGSNKGICQGDSGGPLIYNEEIVGIGSFVSSLGCEDTEYPKVLTRVFKFLDWIEQKSGVKPQNN